MSWKSIAKASCLFWDGGFMQVSCVQTVEWFLFRLERKRKGNRNPYDFDLFKISTLPVYTQVARLLNIALTIFKLVTSTDCLFLFICHEHFDVSDSAYRLCIFRAREWVDVKAFRRAHSHRRRK